MKKLLFVAACVFATAAALAQGTVNFASYVPASGLNVKVFDTDGLTPLTGPNYVAQLYAGTSATSLSPVGSAVAFGTAARAGYIIGGGAVTIPTIAGGATATIELKAWDSTKGTSWELAQSAGSAVGASTAFTVVLGGGGVPPGPPADLVGLTTFSLVAVPEPSTIALGFLGGAALLLRRRNK